MRLGIAFGARGRGRALAHYESALHVINLTKLKGAGSLAHEWGHALDAYLGTHLDFGKINSFASASSVNRLNDRGPIGAAMAEVRQAIRYKELTEADIKAAYYAEVQKIKAQIETSIQKTLEAYKQDYSKADDSVEVTNLMELGEEFRNYLTDGTLHSYEEYIQQITSNNPKYITHWARRALIGLKQQRSLLERQQSLLRESGSGVTAKSNYLESAIELDKGRRVAYYSAPEEMFARAFESYIFDKLESQGITSQYLVHSVSNKFYGDYSPYPTGEERQKINLAIDNLIRVLKREFNLGDFEYNHLYEDKQSHVSYVQSIRTITKPLANEASTLKQKLNKLCGNPIQPDIRSYMDKLAIYGKQAYGFIGVGFRDIPTQYMKTSHSKAFLVNQQRLMIDIKAKPEKQLEALLEALMYFTVEIKFSGLAPAMREQLMEGATYSICKHFGLDVRTYCIGPEYEEIAKDTKKEVAYLEACKRATAYILDGIANL